MRCFVIYPLVLVLCWLPALKLQAQKKGILYRPFHSHLQSGTIRDFLNEINARSGVLVEFASGSFPTDKPVTVNEEAVTLAALLQQVLTGEKVRAIEKNDKLLLIPSPSPLADDALLPVYSFFGIVSEEGSLEPLTEATIWEPSTHKGTISNVHGYFSLSLPEG